MAIFINEVYPNPAMGEEWVELKIVDETAEFQASDLLGFTLSDDYHVIYQFDGEENSFNQFLLILVSGLNNSGDSVVLKNANQEVADEMSYKSSQKDQSWARDKDGFFYLTKPSPLADNPNPTVTPTNNPSPTLSLSPNPSPSYSISPNPSITIKPEASPNPSITTTVKATSKKDFDVNLAFPNYQKLDYWPKTSNSSSSIKKNSRLQFFGQKILTGEVKDAIMGCALFIVSAVLLSYEQKKESPHSSAF